MTTLRTVRLFSIVYTGKLWANLSIGEQSKCYHEVFTWVHNLALAHHVQLTCTCLEQRRTWLSEKTTHCPISRHSKWEIQYKISPGPHRSDKPSLRLAEILLQHGSDRDGDTELGAGWTWLIKSVDNKHRIPPQA